MTEGQAWILLAEGFWITFAVWGILFFMPSNRK